MLNKVGVVIPCLSDNIHRAEHLREKILSDNKDSRLDVNITIDQSVKECEFGEKGFTINANDGIRHYFLSNSMPEYIWIINDDATPSENYLSECLKAFETSDDIAIVSGIIVDSKDKDTILWAGSGACYPNGIHRVGYLTSLGNLNKPSLQKWITFCSVVIKSSALINVGLLDESMRFVYSDSDWCYRARAMGMKCLYWPHTITYHDRGVATGNGEKSDQLIKEFFRDRIKFENKWLSSKLFEELDAEVM